MGRSQAVDVSFTLHAKQNEGYVKLFGDKGGCELEPEPIIVSEKHDTIVNMYPQFSAGDVNQSFQNEMVHFIHCVQTGETPISPVQDGVEMMKILCGVYESAAKGQEIRY